jgi:peptidyl-prolyl cis-trans isomerase B (cyclophilin B)
VFAALLLSVATISPMHTTRTRLATLAALPLLLLAASCGSAEKKDADVKGTTGTQCEYTSGGTASKSVELPPAAADPDPQTSLVISTSAGDIPITLEPKTAPCAVNSFISLAKQGYFDNTSCHRLTTNGYYVLQCGDPTGTGSGGPGYSFADELVANDSRLQPCTGQAPNQVCTYNTGLIAMANAGPDTNGSQFFLVYGNSQFPPAYDVLGHMDAAGLKVVKSIAAKGIGTQGMGPGDGSPKEKVTITSVK